MNSMTGHGHAQRVMGNGRVIAVEVDSINKRGLECSIRLPDELVSLEGRLRQLVSEQVQRGKISLSVTLSFRKETASSGLAINEKLLASYDRQLRALAKKLGIKAEMPLPYLLSLPGVLASESQLMDESSAQAILKTAKKALECMTQFRRREGAFLCRSLQAIIKKMSACVLNIERCAPQILERYRKQLIERIGQAGVALTLDDERIAKEVAFFADRSDITEEITRLKAHLKEAARLLQSSEACGRTLDFLLQEVGREINTVGSKAAGLKISQQVIAFKADLERIREQAQNLE